MCLQHCPPKDVALQLILWRFLLPKGGRQAGEGALEYSKLVASFPSLESKPKCIISSFLFASKTDEEEVGNRTIQLPNN